MKGPVELERMTFLPVGNPLPTVLCCSERNDASEPLSALEGASWPPDHPCPGRESYTSVCRGWFIKAFRFLNVFGGLHAIGLRPGPRNSLALLGLCRLDGLDSVAQASLPDP
jgi:hypothetical protein